MGDHEKTARYETIGVEGAVSSVTRVAEPTGDARVDEALAGLGRLGQAPVAEHVEIFDDVHQRLSGVLASIDQDGSPVPSSPAPRS